MTARVRVVLALACAALAVFASHAYAEDVRRQEAQLRQETLERYGGEVVSLVVATHQLEAGETLTEADVSLKEWVSELAPEGALMSLDEALGGVPCAPVAKGQVLTKLTLTTSASSLEIPSGMVAVSLSLTDKLALISGVDAGSRVFAYRVTDDGVQLVSSRVTVVSVTSEGSALSSSKDVTVAARPADIPALLEAAAEGTLRLVVPASNVTAASAGVTPAPSVVEPETVSTDSDAKDNDTAETEQKESSPSESEEPEPQATEGNEDGHE